MADDDRMTEFESALFQALLVIAETLSRAHEINREKLIADLDERSDWFSEDGKRNGAAILKMLADGVREPNVYFRLTKPSEGH